MTGPPTPPPTSAIELEDAARAQAAFEVPQASTLPQQAEVPQPPPPAEQPLVEAALPTTIQPLANVYRQAFPVLVTLAGEGNFQGLRDTAEISDMNARDDRHLDRLLVTVPLVLSSLILDDIPPAVHALTRLPENLSSTPLPQTLFKLAASVSERKYSNVYSRAAEVHEASQRTEGVPGDLTHIVHDLLGKFIDRFRQKTFALLSRAYTSLAVSLVQRYLNMSAEQVLSVAAEYHWKYDAATQVLSPVPPRNSVGARLTDQSTLATLSSVASIGLE